MKFRHFSRFRIFLSWISVLFFRYIVVQTCSAGISRSSFGARLLQRGGDRSVREPALDTSCTINTATPNGLLCAAVQLVESMRQCNGLNGFISTILELKKRSELTFLPSGDPIRGGKPHKYIASDDNPFASRNDKVFTMLFVSKHQGILPSR